MYVLVSNDNSVTFIPLNTSLFFTTRTVQTEQREWVCWRPDPGLEWIQTASQQHLNITKNCFYIPFTWVSNSNTISRSFLIRFSTDELIFLAEGKTTFYPEINHTNAIPQPHEQNCFYFPTALRQSGRGRSPQVPWRHSTVLCARPVAPPCKHK
jgi:hypothetical protein